MTETTTERVATVRGIGDPAAVQDYLPAGYRVTGYTREGPDRFSRFTATIRGTDIAGWTLEDYVIPRLASGCYACTEVKTV